MGLARAEASTSGFLVQNESQIHPMRMLTTAKRTEHAAKVAGGGQAVDF
jgi:hypothetical protein